METSRLICGAVKAQWLMCVCVCVCVYIYIYIYTYIHIKVKWSRYRPGLAQRMGRGIALLFHDRGTRRGWVVSSTPQPQFTPGKVPVPILQEAWWAPGPVWTGEKARSHRDSIPDRPARSQSLYRLYSTKICLCVSCNCQNKEWLSSLKCINRLLFVMKTPYVYCELWDHCLNII